MNEARFERLLGALLRVGVLASALVIVTGGAIYLGRHAGEPIDYGTFQPDRMPHLRTPHGIVESALGGSGRGIIQLGLLLLIATPVARVVVSAFGFARQRDLIYCLMTVIVLSVLLYSLFFEGH